MDLLDDLGPQLRALTANQPTQPGDRVPAVTRRAGRIRRTRVTVAVAAAVGVLAPAGLLVSSVQHHEATTFAHSDVLTWPDRSVVADRGIGDGAVAALEQDTGAAVLDVRWLYRARVHVPGGNPAYVAVFTAEVQGQNLLVAATSLGRVLDEHGLATDGDTPYASWDTNDRTVLDPAMPVRHVGIYLPYTKDNEHLSFAVVLADPRARTLAWRVDPLPFAPSVRPSGSVSFSSSTGVFLSDLGAITGPVAITLADNKGHELGGPLASGTSQPNLAVPDAPGFPPSWQSVMGAQGQTEKSSAGRWTVPSFSSAPSGLSQRAHTAFVRCYGGGTLHVALQLGEARTPSAQGDVTCDGESHQAFPALSVGNVQETLTLTADRLQVMNVGYGSMG